MSEQYNKDLKDFIQSSEQEFQKALDTLDQEDRESIQINNEKNEFSPSYNRCSFETFEDREHSLNGDFQLWNNGTGKTDLNLTFNQFNNDLGKSFLKPIDRIKALYYCYEVSQHFDNDNVWGDLLQDIRTEFEIPSTLQTFKENPQSEATFLLNDLHFLITSDVKDTHTEETMKLALIGTTHSISEFSDVEIYQIFFIGNNEKLYRFIISQNPCDYVIDYRKNLNKKFENTGETLLNIIKEYHKYYNTDTKEFQCGIKRIVEEFSQTTGTPILYL